ncbi:hypothetical protein Tco_0828985 [Tanacetum coccineum]
MPTTRSGMTSEAIEELIAQRVAKANGNGNGNGNGNENRGRNGNENGNNNNGSGNHGENTGGAMKAAHECTYMEFLNCLPLNFKGTEGAVGLARIVVTDAAYVMTWKELMKLMTELALLCPKMVPDEEEKIERYIWGLPDNIQGNVTSAGIMRLQDTIRMANSLMDQKVRVIAKRDVDNKRKWEDEHAMLELYYSVTNASFITMVHVLLDMETARMYDIKQETTGPLPW